MQNSARTPALARLSANPETHHTRKPLSFLDRPGDIASAAFLTWFGVFLTTHIYFAWPRIAEALLGHAGGAL